jgi:hypothetical protein
MLFQNSFLSLLQHYSLNFDQNSKLDVFKTSTKHPSLRGQQTSSHLWGMVFFRQPFDKIRLFLLYFLRLNMSEYCILSNFSVRKLHFLEKFPFLSGFLWTRHFSLWKARVRTITSKRYSNIYSNIENSRKYSNTYSNIQHV